MISKTTAFTAADGSIHASLVAAQAAELHTLLKPDFTEQAAGELEHICKLLLTRKDAILNILTTTPASRPSRRKANGYAGHTKSKRKAATVAADATPTVASQAA